MKKFFLLSKLIISSLIFQTSCTSVYLDEFDTPVHEGVKNYSLTDIERSIIEMPGDKQDILMGVPGLMISSNSCKDVDIPDCNDHTNKVWICETTSPTGEIEVGHYIIFSREGANGSF